MTVNTPRGDDGRDPLRKALDAIRELRGRLAQVEGGRHEPLAVVGVGCRFPGADSPEAFWQLLSEGVDAVEPVSEALRPRELGAGPGGRPARPGWGAFLANIDRFDADFFGISPAEASRMDPQQRLLLEVGWEALEDAGQPAERWRGRSVGVFVGAHSHSSDYNLRQIRSLEGIGIHTATGNAHSILSNRLSYVFDWHGPSLTVDTACSSSLVAVHLAARSLRAGECDMALAAGVNLILSPETSASFEKLEMMAGDGRCKTFDARADGFVRGEGCGVVVLRRLSDALEAGDPVLAVLAGSAVNQDGSTNGLTAPSGLAQEQVLRAALADARLSPADVTYIETHGTGTALGDPIEVEALARVFGGAGEARCHLGAVKTNIGHLEGAAGIAGLIKVVLCLQRGIVPRNLHFSALNPHISLDGSRLAPAVEACEWTGAGRAAGVSSFGFGGTNAHVLVRARETAPRSAGSDEPQPGPVLLPLSARSPRALDDLCARWGDFLSGLPATEVPGVVRSAALTRSFHEYRTALVVDTPAEAVARLRDSAIRSRPGRRSGRANGGSRAGLAFVFPGQGAQWEGMGRDLLDVEPAFRDAVQACDELLNPELGWSVVEALRSGSSGTDGAELDLARTEVAQPLVFALQTGLLHLWRSWGVEPEAVVGHSVGEVAAAFAAGVLTLEDACLVVRERSRILRQAPLGGRMVAVEVPAATLEARLARTRSEASVAASNAPSWSVLSGDARSVDAVVAALEAEDVVCRRLPGAYAFHSPHMEPFRGPLVEALAGISPRPARIPVFSAVTGTVASSTDFGAEYWGRNLRQRVRFSEAMTELLRAGHGQTLELGPHPTLTAMVDACRVDAIGMAEGRRTEALPSLRRGHAARPVLLDALSALWVSGHDVRWDRVNRGPRSDVQLPRYPWQRTRHWFEAPRPQEGASSPEVGARESSDALPGRRLPSALPVFEMTLGGVVGDMARAHRIRGLPTLPASVILEWVRMVAASGDPDTSVRVNDVEFVGLGALPDLDAGRCQGRLQLTLLDAVDRRRSFRVHAGTVGSDGTWTLLARGYVEPVPATPEADRDAEEPVASAALDARRFYSSLEIRGADIGTALQSLREIRREIRRESGRESGRDRVLVDIHVPDEVPAGSTPGLVLTDGALQAALGRLMLEETPGLLALSSIDSFEWSRPPAAWGPSMVVEVTANPTGTLDLSMRSPRGAILGVARGVRLRPLSDELLAPHLREATRGWSYRVAWHEIGTGSPAEVATRLAERVREAAALNGRHAAADADAARHALEALAARHARAAIRTLRGARDDREAGTSVVPRHRHLFRRVSDMAMAEHPADAPAPLAAADLIARFPQHRHEITLLDRCGRELAGVLRGDVDPLELLFSSAEEVTAASLYRHAPSARRVSTLAADALEVASIRAASGEGLRILEVGAGTGGTTTLLLDRLAGDWAEYVFTDVSPVLVDEARARLGRLPGMRFDTFDVETGRWGDRPARPGSFDAVVAANVLHATADLGRSLGNLRELLAPGGLLILAETTAPRDWLDLVFGMTSGWWRVADAAAGGRDGRIAHPLLDPDGWAKALRGAGFDEVAAVSADPEPEPGEDPGEDPGGDPGGGPGTAVLPQTLVLAATSARAQAQAQPPALARARTPRDAEPGFRVLLSDGSPLAHELAAQLAGSGHGCLVASRGTAFRVTTDERGGLRVEMDPGDPSHHAALLARGAEHFGGPVHTLVHFWGAEGRPTRPDDPAGEAVDLLTGAMLASRAFAGAASTSQPGSGRGPGRDPRPGLWFVTSGVHPAEVDASPLSLAQAPLWGFGRSLALESPMRWGGLVDCSAGCPDPTEADSLHRLITGHPREDQVVCRGPRMWVARLEREAQPDGPEVTLDPDAAYLVTGGLGGLGRKVARWLVGRGARHLHLTHRRPLSEAPARLHLLEDLRAMGVKATPLRMDAGDRDQVDEFLRELRAEDRRLAGVFHLAADIESCPLEHLDAARLGAAMRAKAKGAWILDRATRGLPLDHFVLFSSMTSWLGSPDLAPYAAANQFLDTLVQQRVRDGLPGLAVDWGTWDDMSALAPERAAAALRAGLPPMPGPLALTVLGRLAREGRGQHTVARIEWGALEGAYSARRSSRFLRRITAANAAPTAPTAPATTVQPVLRPDEDTAGTLRTRLAAAHPGDGRALVSEVVGGAVRWVLGLGEGDPIDPRRGLFDLGFDSLMTVQLRERLSHAAGMRLPSSLVLNHPSVDALTEYLSGRLFGEAGGETPSSDASSELESEIAALSDEESRDELVAELRALGVDDDG